MARLMEDRRTKKMTKVGWVEFIDGERSSRSKQLDTEEQALLFKSLVEENDEAMPSYVKLAEHGLIQFGFTIAPKFVLGIRELIFLDHMTDEQKVNFLKKALEDF